MKTSGIQQTVGSVEIDEQVKLKGHVYNIFI